MPTHSMQLGRELVPNQNEKSSLPPLSCKRYSGISKFETHCSYLFNAFPFRYSVVAFSCTSMVAAHTCATLCKLYPSHVGKQRTWRPLFQSCSCAQGAPAVQFTHVPLNILNLLCSHQLASHVTLHAGTGPTGGDTRKQDPCCHYPS